jgi:anti-sigma regulatory factor (Ser/Thr protein kinase)
MEQPLQLSGGPNNTGSHNRYNIKDRSYINLIKKEASKAAMEEGFSKERVGKLDIILSELISNLLKFGKGEAELLWKMLTLNGEIGIEIIAIDKGQGIHNIAQALKDGYSTAGTAGEGLGAIKRLSDYSEIYSQDDIGTIVLSRLSKKENNIQFKKQLHISAIAIPKPGEVVSGDGNVIIFNPNDKVFRIFLIDGLGHGAYALEASDKAIGIYKKKHTERPDDVLFHINEAIRETRGGVGMALDFDFETQMISFSGIGNIQGRIIGVDKTSGLFSRNGILGHVFPKDDNLHQLKWSLDNLLILNSDGISSKYSLSKYPKIQMQDPAIIGACLYRDYGRNDDVTVIVSKFPLDNEN